MLSFSFLTFPGIYDVNPALKTMTYDEIRLDQMQGKGDVGGDAIYQKKAESSHPLAGIRKLNNV